MKSIEKNIEKITITVDYRSELLGIIMWLSDYHNQFPHLFQPYANKFFTDNIIQKFNEFKKEPAILEFNELVKKHGFSYDAPISLFLQINENFDCNDVNDYILKERLHNDPSIFKFLEDTKAFAKKIHFEKYYQQNIPLYKKWISDFSKTFENTKIIDFFTNYFGYQNNAKFYINLMPYTTEGAYCCYTNNKIYACFPVSKKTKKKNLFDTTNREKNIIDTVVHEFCHSYINPITQKSKINLPINFFDKIKSQMNKIAYTNDNSIINEHIVRAIEIRFIKIFYNDDEWAQSRMDKEKENGFIYIKTIVNSLIEYEKKRKEYPTIEAFYPQIIKALQKNTN